MSYVLEQPTASALVANAQSIDDEIAEVHVGLRQDHTGDAVLSFQVVLKDRFELGRPSKATGERLQQIASALRQRAADLGVPIFASVRFIHESEYENLSRKIA